LRGELVADVLTDFPERFRRFGKSFRGLRRRQNFGIEIEKFWFQKDRIVLKFKGFDSIETAETLRDCEICVPESEAVELEEGEFFDWELEGCAVETSKAKKSERSGSDANGRNGNFGRQTSEKEYLIPFAETICTEVDVENKLIKVDAPEGLA
jgi:16S rRNA processing protein RimM